LSPPTGLDERSIFFLILSRKLASKVEMCTPYSRTGVSKCESQDKVLMLPSCRCKHINHKTCQNYGRNIPLVNFPVNFNKFLQCQKLFRLEFWGFQDGDTSSRGLLGCDAV
jgi:hypothetical protein